MGYRIIMGFFVLLVIYVSIHPFAAWYWQQEKVSTVAVMDKTVPNSDYREHLGLFWVLEHNKTVKPDSTAYYLKKDYYGYDPETKQGHETFDIPENVDLMYIADAYGVYEADLADNRNIIGKRSELLYGGMTIFEWNRIMERKTSDNTLIVEFNSLASPTEPAVRRTVENNLGIRWSGWIGRYFPDLQDKEVPVWLKENWEAQNNQKWNFTGEGLAFADESDHIVVVPEKDFSGKVELAWTEAALKKYPHVQNAEYGYWFDIIVPTGRVTAEATYQLDLTEQAKNELQKNGIPLEFPAVLHNEAEKMYYFSGDFADINTDYMKRWHLPEWAYAILAFFNAKDQFFWEVYVPLMNEIIRSESERKNA